MLVFHAGIISVVMLVTGPVTMRIQPTQFCSRYLG